MAHRCCRAWLGEVKQQSQARGEGAIKAKSFEWKMWLPGPFLACLLLGDFGGQTGSTLLNSRF